MNARLIMINRGSQKGNKRLKICQDSLLASIFGEYTTGADRAQPVSSQSRIKGIHSVNKYRARATDAGTTCDQNTSHGPSGTHATNSYLPKYGL